MDSSAMQAGVEFGLSETTLSGVASLGGNFGLDEAFTLERGFLTFGVLLENVPSTILAVESALAADGTQSAAAQWADDFTATLCRDSDGEGDAFVADADSVSSLIGELLGGEVSAVDDIGISKFAEQQCATSWDGASRQAHDSGLASEDDCVMYHLQPTSTSRSQLPSAYEFGVLPVIACVDASVANSTREASSPAGTMNSATTLTEDVEEFFADLDNFLSGAQLPSTSENQFDDISSYDDAASEASQSKSDESWSINASQSQARCAVPLSPSRNAESQAPRRRGRKRCMSPSTRRERKRQQNREAAQRYRSKKNGEAGTLDSQLERAESRNRHLRDTLQRAETERRILLRFAEHFDLRGLMREQLASAQKDSPASAKRLNSSLAALQKMIGQKPVPAEANGTRRSATSAPKIVTVVRAAPAVVASDATKKRRDASACHITPSKLARR